MQKTNCKKYFPLKKSTARLYAVQALFQMEASKASIDEVISEFVSHRIDTDIDGKQYHSADLKLFRDILRTVVKQQSEIDQLTNKSLKDTWQLNRIDPTLRALFRAAIAELIEGNVPPKATISEYLDLSKAFFSDGKETKLLNGVLNNILEIIKDPT